MISGIYKMNVEITKPLSLGCNVKYLNRLLSDYSLWELVDFLKSFKLAEARREEASKHHKFDKVNNKKAMEFPPINPEFLKLKEAIEKEIRNKQNA